jgi:endonuclease-8
MERMPEGDTVFRTARAIHRAFAGRRLTASDLRVPRLAASDLTGWTVIESVSRGKHLLLRMRTPEVEQAMTLHSHLGMDGSWRVYAVGERWRVRRRHLVRAVLRTADAIAVGCQLREISLVPTGQEKNLVDHLGPDLLGPGWEPDEAVRRLARRPTTEIGVALRDQRNLAGIGNVYCSEVLFLRGVWPWTPLAQVADLPALVALAHRLLEANRDRAVRTTTGSLRRGETTYVYGRRGEPCRRCGTSVEAAPQGASSGTSAPAPDRALTRTTFWCPGCQPEVRAPPS